jgi:hypothetical protein
LTEAIHHFIGRLFALRITQGMVTEANSLEWIAEHNNSSEFCPDGQQLRFTAKGSSVIGKWLENKAQEWGEHLEACERCRSAWFKIHRHGW